MKRLLAVLAVLVPNCGVFAADLEIGNWNVQTLTYLGDTQTVFPGDYVRKDADLADLRMWRDQVGASVYFLQEVTSPAAIDEVFPVAAGWQHCISGQYAHDEQLTTSGPVCTKAGDTPLRPTGSVRKQYTAVAWRTDSGANVGPVADFADLNVKSDDGGTIRDVRWGLDVTLAFGGAQMRALVVHMKSGCFDDRLDFRLFTVPPKDPPAKSSCDTLGRQMYPLRQWVEARNTGGDAWMVVGDFNRRLDMGAGTFQDEVWQAISGYSPGSDGKDRDSRPDIELFRAPYKKASVCWADTINPTPAGLADADDFNMAPIEFFLFGRKTVGLVTPGTEQQIAWTPSLALDQKRLSDHCPSRMTLHG